MDERGKVNLRLKPGDVVEVRPPAEILASLDPTGALGAVPFMPEMLQFVGKRFTVSKRVEKICDTIGPGGSRRMRDTVFLENMRCDGSAHGGCQAECRIYWKEAWLAKVETSRDPNGGSDEDAAALERVVQSNTRPQFAKDSEAGVFKCQATEAFRATEMIVSVVSPGQYVREVAGGNISIGSFLRVAMRGLYWKIGTRLGLDIGSRKRSPYVKLTANDRVPEGRIGLQPGEWVEVKSAEEIGRTLNAEGSNRGLRFSPNEMIPACGRKFRVRRRIERLVDEKTGRILSFRNDCIALEGLVCAGDRSTGRWFCARELYPYWREAWLKRADPPHPSRPGR
jgi:hypothetical protein